ncbi:bifunctional 4-hydroxy-2-oxoglutarate aldolase/2-dehydro-3-deoxy-phosphogluconate aldolase [Flammeovirga kamogawensis]|uniref:Bifunctional 4-hydroxy-2-oxoglutarate aldolase/2-dehydro-3-deoxy-phosphogluconate aldolase n=1 Tax=Flammeovirga kamogawensis TaxID=373891 RepID=A0ABX8H432_9BACT|nr:bifunctional 4-hydroxy-2-oxoglutarate aldolase/2-dehydro-3-deoxy-phosphogluconate aldolase [Flammeovirga kamogawensis]MBB6460358.1 2-dehydro-3-deoxyphosphogluconate aldolase/(4S)-4-hydroxy-2-oxoglutarate aldolase [Flammeovirga kamogawensis]QWG10167.1 bifunctional 4-hydroxy-2-oxoglutarate aldolase/2-dehydro-3-deoxy-phosphogluconate aldolase [Flammeovirga kamogawensis]TRX64619.1 bifunctional 4-hydroxy-2-oxoglutarate aldolase/2-dehydro-3-deoxy-phosphogluconate aldolase [Flammeovirga kamogawensis
MKFSRIDIALMMKSVGMIPVFYHKDIEICKQVLAACYKGGARVFEFTNRGDFAHEVFAELVHFRNKELPELALGIGSIYDAPTTALYLQLGADFIVSPILNAEMAKVCNRRKVSWSPGCGTLTEISYAEELGAEVVKIFPGAQVGGPEFVKAVNGPQPWSSIMPTGGVKPTEENLRSWIDAGVHCVGIGSQLFVKDKNGDFSLEQIENKVAYVIEMIHQIRVQEVALV